MGYKEKFTAEEWELLQNGPMWVYRAVAGADNKIDKKETKAFKKLMKNITNLSNDFIKEVLAGLDYSDVELKKPFNPDSPELRAALKELSDILNFKCERENALYYKKTLIAMGVFIGESSGSLFDYKFSNEEKEALMNVGFTLEISVADLFKTDIIHKIISLLNK